MTVRSLAIISILGTLSISGCTGEPGERSLATPCADGLNTASRELRNAEARGLTGSVQWTKAASLLAAAKVQQQFEEYQNCVIKVREARGYLREIADG
jgi:hypothetical protein